MKRILRSAAILLMLQGFSACNDKPQPPAEDTSIPKDSPRTEIPPAPPARTVEVQTFEVKDAQGKMLGWGYELWMNGKRWIRQEIIPMVEGNNYFKTEEEARRTGDLAAEKARRTGELPTLTLQELDSLGVWKMK